MTKTVKKLIIKIKQEIKKLKNDFIPLYEWVESQTDYLEELKQQQLYKEDFIVHKFCVNCRGDYFIFDNKCNTCSWKRIINLKDSSKYDKLPSKDVK
ncbi:MAG: hypothetical protein SPLM_01870 [Spiroplasma phoeniceum]|uniref:hypothetical protein n=1 Tax=Spiroplasma phoeniceum TaxID=47835 RepID=UPI003288B5E7